MTDSTVILGKSAALDGEDDDMTPAIRLVDLDGVAFALAVSQQVPADPVNVQVTEITNGETRTIPAGRKQVEMQGTPMIGGVALGNVVLPALSTGAVYAPITVTAPSLGSVKIIEIF